MAKKGTRRTGEKPGGTSRKRTIPLADVDKASQLLAQQSHQLAALADILREEKLAEIEIDGFGLLQRGVDEIDRFIDNVDKGVNQARRDKRRSEM